MSSNSSGVTYHTIHLIKLSYTSLSCRFAKAFLSRCHKHKRCRDFGKTVLIALFIALSPSVTTEIGVLLFIATSIFCNTQVYVLTFSLTNSPKPNTIVYRWWLTPTNMTRGFLYTFVLYVVSNATTSPKTCII